MKILLLILGVAIQIAVLIDIFKTIIYINGGGIISSFTAKSIWRIFFKLSNGNGNNKILNLAGPFILMAFLFIWITSIWLGYCLIYISDTYSVIDNRSETPATILDKIYYVGYTLTSLGNGGFRAGSDKWQLISNIVGLNSMIFISLGISYLLPVLQAVIDKRSLAVHINTLGSTPEEIIKNGFDGKSFDMLYQRFSTLENLLIKHGERHLAYPILHYFHTDKKTQSIPLNLALLDEVITIQEIYNIDNSPKNYNWKIIRRALDNYYERLSNDFIIAAEDVPQFYYKEKLNAEFANKVMASQETKLSKLEERRKKVLGYVRNDGWKWDDVIINDQESNPQF